MCFAGHSLRTQIYPQSSESQKVFPVSVTVTESALSYIYTRRNPDSDNWRHRKG